MIDDYSDDINKMALISTSSQLAKEDGVKRDGIGEDLSFNFFGWDGPRLRIICQMGKESMKQIPANRFQQSFNVCLAMRKYWHVTDITMVAEGFVSLDPLASRGKDLKQMFANTEKIKECLTITHACVSKESEKPVVSLVAIPYSYGTNRSVKWKKMLAAPDDATKILRESMFPSMMVSILGEKIDMNADEASRHAIVKQMYRDGFEVFEFSELDN